jgi:serine/threonine protein kinase
VGRQDQPKRACLDENHLAAFADDPFAMRAAMEEHLADCAECRAVLARMAAGVTDAATPYIETTDASGREHVETGELPSGTSVGRYLIGGVVGRGAMGTVYEASDPDLHRKVAVKVLRADALSDVARQKMRARLLREAQAMARLSHPEVITVYDVGSLGDQLFVAMEYVEGETLKQWCAARPRSCAEILGVYERAGQGLAAAHEAGLVHRDFKPDNVLVARDGRVRVTDFGLARSVDGDTGWATSLDPSTVECAGSSALTSTLTTLTRTGALLGTPAYMAPEQLRGGAADARSDVFSFCVALYEALYRKRPFAGLTMTALRAAIEQGALRPVPGVDPVPRWLRGVILRGLRADPEQRFASMRELLDALHRAQETSRRQKALAAWVSAGALLVAFAGGTALRKPAVTERKDGMSFPSAPTAPVPAATIGSSGEGTPPAAMRSSAAESAAFIARSSPTPTPTASALKSSPRARGAPAPRPSASAPPPPATQEPAAAPTRWPSAGHNGAFILE